jgi:hypothetical protein
VECYVYIGSGEYMFSMHALRWNRNIIVHPCKICRNLAKAYFERKICRNLMSSFHSNVVALIVKYCRICRKCGVDMPIRVWLCM